MIRCKRSLRSICNLQHDDLPSLWFDRNFQAPFAARAEKFVCFDDLIELETVREQRQWIEAFRLHHRHQPAHPFFPARAKRGHDFVITKARLQTRRTEPEVFPSKRRGCSTCRRDRDTQSVLKRCLKSERFDCHICAAAGELLDFSNDVARLRIDNNVRAHLLRHFHSNGIAVHAYRMISASNSFASRSKCRLKPTCSQQRPVHS